MGLKTLRWISIVKHAHMHVYLSDKFLYKINTIKTMTKKVSQGGQSGVRKGQKTKFPTRISVLSFLTATIFAIHHDLFSDGHTIVPLSTTE